MSISFGGHPLLDDVDFQLQAGDRACLVGRNGEGKSTLLRILAGELEPDAGTVTLAPNTRVALLPQVVPARLDGRVRDLVAAGLAVLGNLDAADRQRRMERILSLVKLDGDAAFASLSGGLKRRTLLARALVADPEVLLLDEPTNHLDIESIEWMESFVKRYCRTLMFVTHDRMFLRRMATRIVDLDRGQVAQWECDYDTFLRRKRDLLDDEAARNVRFDKKLSREEVWIRQGIKARRTRNEGRVRALEALRREREARRSVLGTSRLRVQEADASGEKVIAAKDVTFGYQNAPPVVSGLTTTIMRGDKVGIVGPNGCGKTTLLKLLLGPHAAGAAADNGLSRQRESIDHRVFTFEVSRPAAGGLTPSSGSVVQGTRLEVAYFDQHRHELDDSASVFDNVAHGAESVTIDGAARNVYGYLQEFLFTPDRARSPVSVLSGGERNRLLLARLFARPANLIVMDEPTNDLDAETLELLEERLVAYAGTLLIVSHDREFLNNVVTSTLVFEGDGRVKEYAGGYDDWVRQRAASPASADLGTVRKADASTADRPRTRRLSYNESRELERLPGRIDALEREQAELHARINDPAAYSTGGQGTAGALAAAAARLEELERELAAAYERWAALDDIRG